MEAYVALTGKKVKGRIRKKLERRKDGEEFRKKYLIFIKKRVSFFNSFWFESKNR